MQQRSWQMINKKCCDMEGDVRRCMPKEEGCNQWGVGISVKSDYFIKCIRGGEVMSQRGN